MSLCWQQCDCNQIALDAAFSTPTCMLCHECICHPHFPTIACSDLPSVLMVNKTTLQMSLVGGDCLADFMPPPDRSSPRRMGPTFVEADGAPVLRCCAWLK